VVVVVVLPGTVLGGVVVDEVEVGVVVDVEVEVEVEVVVGGGAAQLTPPAATAALDSM
jgi:hypothetical protein